MPAAEAVAAIFREINSAVGRAALVWVAIETFSIASQMREVGRC